MIATNERLRKVVRFKVVLSFWKQLLYRHGVPGYLHQSAGATLTNAGCAISVAPRLPDAGFAERISDGGAI